MFGRLSPEVEEKVLDVMVKERTNPPTEPSRSRVSDDVIALLLEQTAECIEHEPEIPFAIAPTRLRALVEELRDVRDACSYALDQCSEAFNAGDFEKTCDRVVVAMDRVLNHGGRADG